MQNKHPDWLSVLFTDRLDGRFTNFVKKKRVLTLKRVIWFACSRNVSGLRFWRDNVCTQLPCWWQVRCDLPLLLGHWAVLSCGAVYYALQGGSNFWVCGSILKFDHSNESYWAVLSCGAVYYALQGDSNVWVCGWNPKVQPFKWKLLSSTFLWCCLLCCTRWF